MKKFSSPELIRFFQGVGSLLEAGLSLMTALEIQMHQHKTHRVAVKHMIQCVQQGESFSIALEKHLQVSRLILLHIRQSETHGDLRHACSWVVAWLQHLENWKKTLWQLSFYPLLLIITGIVLCCVMLTFVLPEFASLYETLNIALPPSTTWLMLWGNSAGTWVSYIAIMCLIAIVSLMGAWQTSHGRYSLERIALKVPGLKCLIFHHHEYQFSLQLGMLLKGGTPLLQAIEMLRAGASSPILNGYLTQTRQRIRLGQSLTQSLCHGLLSSHTFEVLITHAQHTGILDTTLLNLANRHMDAAKQWQDTSKHFIQPCMTLFLGGFLGIWILLLYYPMLQLGTNLG